MSLFDIAIKVLDGFWEKNNLHYHALKKQREARKDGRRAPFGLDPNDPKFEEKYERESVKLSNQSAKGKYGWYVKEVEYKGNKEKRNVKFNNETGDVTIYTMQNVIVSSFRMRPQQLTRELIDKAIKARNIKVFTEEELRRFESNGRKIRGG